MSRSTVGKMCVCIRSIRMWEVGEDTLKCRRWQKRPKILGRGRRDLPPPSPNCGRWEEREKIRENEKIKSGSWEGWISCTPSPPKKIKNWLAQHHLYVGASGHMLGQSWPTRKCYWGYHLHTHQFLLVNNYSSTQNHWTD